MRLSEIELNEIEDILLDNFIINGTHSIDKGIVSIDGNCVLDVVVQKLPVKFGKVSGNFSCANLGLKTLENFPMEVGGSVNISSNTKLTSLNGSPQYIGGTFRCIATSIVSFEGGPKTVMGSFVASNNNDLESINGLPEIINGKLNIPFYPDMPVLKLLLIKMLNEIAFIPPYGDSVLIQRILNKYVGQGQKGALQCAMELTKAGFKRYARI